MYALLVLRDKDFDGLGNSVVFPPEGTATPNRTRATRAEAAFEAQGRTMQSLFRAQNESTNQFLSQLLESRENSRSSSSELTTSDEKRRKERQNSICDHCRWVITNGSQSNILYSVDEIQRARNALRKLSLGYRSLTDIEKDELLQEQEDLL